jgi:hypothetical protein
MKRRVFNERIEIDARVFTLRVTCSPSTRISIQEPQAVENQSSIGIKFLAVEQKSRFKIPDSVDQFPKGRVAVRGYLLPVGTGYENHITHRVGVKVFSRGGVGDVRGDGKNPANPSRAADGPTQVRSVRVYFFDRIRSIENR